MPRMGAVDAIIEHVLRNPGTTPHDAARALGLSPSSAQRARRRLEQEALPREPPKLVPLDVPPPPDLTGPAVDFWANELAFLARHREMCANDGSWVAVSQLSRQLHTARQQYDAAAAANPPPRDARTDEELLQELQEELAALPDLLRRGLG